MSLAKTLPNIHPGEVLREEFLAPMSITPYRLAKSLDISQTHVGEMIRGERGITAATAVKLAAFFGTSAEFWMNLQSRYDLEEARKRLASELESIPSYREFAKVV